MTSRLIERLLCCAVLPALLSSICLAQNTEAKAPPVLDVHVHAMDGFPGVGPMCPNTSKFIASDPKEKEGPFGWATEQCTPMLYPPAAPGDYMKDVVAEMERLNVTAVVFGDPKSVQKWKDAAPATGDSRNVVLERHGARTAHRASTNCAKISPAAASK